MITTHRYRLLLSLAALLCAHGLASAQHPLKVLIEEGTNASCEPCAWQSPIFDAFLERDDVAPFVVPLVYHAFWPGPDTMNKRAPEMNDARIRGYYGMLGMPTVVVGGQNYRSATPGLAGGAPADTTALRRLVDSLRALTTPVAIRIVDTIDADELHISTSVTSDSVLDASLRIAIVERHHFYPWPTAGNNGEEHFHYIVRAMPGGPGGRTLLANPGESLTFFDTVAIDPEWIRSELYVVAFVQRDDTREVLQAASTREHVHIAPQINRAQRPDDQSLARWTSSAQTSRDGAHTVVVERDLPPGWTAAIDVGGVRVDSHATFTLDSGASLPLSVVIAPAPESAGRAVVRVIVVGDRGAIDTAEYRAYAGPIDILLLAWHPPDRSDVAEMFDVALAGDDIEYVIVHPDDDRLFTLKEHRLVIVATGDDSINVERRARLREYLDARGRLLISGSNIAQSLGDPEFDQTGIPRDTAFLHGYLHASYAAPTSASLAINGLRSDPIGANIGFVLKGGRRPIGTPDIVRAGRHALPVFHYGSARTSIAALRYGRPEHRVVFLAFGAEAIPDSTTRSQVVQRSVDWLLGEEITMGVQFETTADVRRVHVTPNPVHGAARADIVVRTPGRYMIYSTLGELLIEGDLAVGDNAIAIDGRSLGAGIYMLVVDVSDGRAATSFIVN